MNKRMKQQLREAMYVEVPRKGKQDFIETLRPREIGWMDFLVQQIPYIHKSIWIWALCLLGITMTGIVGNTMDSQRLIESLIPLTASIVVAQGYRSYACQMNELELATRFSLRSVFFARMVVIGIVYGILWIVISLMVSAWMKTDWLLILLRILISYLFTNSLCLHIERSETGRKHKSLSLVIAMILSIGTFFFGTYSIVMISVGTGAWMVLGLLVVNGYENLKTIRWMEV